MTAQHSPYAFIKHHFRHFNAATVVDATDAWIAHHNGGNKMMLTLAGAMSTAEMGISIAELIRQGLISAITCTGANLEEDVFNLVAHSHYERVPGYRELSAAQEQALHDRGMNRVTDTCIPEDEAMRLIESHVLEEWMKADAAQESYFPHQYLYKILLSGKLTADPHVDPKNSWLLAAAEKNLPIFVPGWEDSTLGNMFVSAYKKGEVKSLNTMKSGLFYMDALIDFYMETTQDRGLGFFQIGGGIAGDFPICVVPLINQDLREYNATNGLPSARLWSYFCQISDSTTSFGSYSGAVPNEKITWGKLSAETPRFVIESDATIVAPLVFQAVLEKLGA